ncbi:MAG: STAS-like domain-containing protein [Cyclobacteriaceae bacterium]|nr:STAS-like domain-containing protein [Cyclobacteriaceae bacterium]
MNSVRISLADDFSPYPAGRFLEDGPFSGQSFREKFLLPALKSNDMIIIDMDGSELPGSSFLEEAFGGLVRLGHSASELVNKLEIKSERKTDKMRIFRYITSASTSSKLK